MDGRPGCACAERAAETLHAERSAEAAAAEDFDPLRIRPYVMLPNASARPEAMLPNTSAGPDGPDEGAPAAPEAPAERTMRLGAVVPAAEPAPAEAEHPSPPSAGRAPRRRRLAALTVGAVAAVVVATAAFASTLFADDATPKQALPDVAGTGVPYSGGGPASAAAPSAAASRTKKAAPGRSASARPSPSPSASRPASPTPSKPAPSPSASTSARPSHSPAGKPLAPAPSSTLRRGDSGPGVLELQQRLAQLGLYNGSADGGFGSRTERAVRDFQSYLGVEGDPAGVYGPPTRQALESVTQRP
ncbi:peptidoglycan-binding protein [Streptomyces sp. NPDC056670]|uniref:peptidoglycan-binding domain-containing protein n=1 Tax=Streptomyces sp. NPDC056670 TaxID=3345904 RepID=UPI00367F2BE0